jgi:CIC family chloride channel protein
MPGGHFLRFPLFKRLSTLLRPSNVRLTDTFYLNLIAVGVGLLVAIFVWLFKGAVNYCSGLVRGDTATQLDFFHDFPLLVFLLPPLGGLLVGFIFRFWGRHRRFRGVSAVIESVARRGGRLNIRKAFIELLNSGLTIVSGMSVGMEGPIVVGGSTIGSNVSDIFRLSATRRRTLLAAGAAAGISAVFNAPIAGFFFALELILGDFSKKAVAAIVLASVSANVTMIALTGGEKVFELPHYGLIHIAEMGNYVVLGIICGLLAYAFAQVLHYCDSFFPRWRIYPPLKPMFGGLLVAALAVFFPEILGTGHELVERLLNGHYPQPQHLFTALHWGSPLLYLAALAVAKLLATSVTLGSGAAGGKFMPSLFMGATVGGVFGVTVNQLGWITTEAPAAYALVGMAAIFGSIAQAPLTVILLVFEMTGNYTVILPMMVAGVISQVVFYSLRRDGVFTHKLAKLGVKFGRGKDLNILESIPVTRAMHRGVETIPESMDILKVRALFLETQHHGFPVVDSTGRLVGMVTTSDLATHKDDPGSTLAGDICTRKVYSLKVSDNCHQAIAILEDYHIGRVPVVDAQERPVGIITRTDIIGAYKLALQERERELEESGGL